MRAFLLSAASCIGAGNPTATSTGVNPRAQATLLRAICVVADATGGGGSRDGGWRGSQRKGYYFWRRRQMGNGGQGGEASGEATGTSNAGAGAGAGTPRAFSSTACLLASSLM